MKTDNISEGQVFKNYKVLCEVLGEKTKTGESKLAQLREMERYFSYEKIQRSFKITKVYDIPLEKPQAIPYLRNMEDLILDMLYFRNSYMQNLLLSKSKFFLELKMINSNYALAKNNKYKFSEVSGEDLIEIEDFYNVSDKMLQRHLESALNNLQDKTAILWRNAFTVCEIEYEGLHGLDFLQRTYVSDMIKQGKIDVQKTYRKATDEEIYRILEAEYSVLKKKGLESKKDIYRKRLTREFTEEVTDIAFDETMILFYYTSYEIIPNKKAIMNIKSISNRLSLEKLREAETKVNNGVAERIVENSVTRHNKASSKTIEEKNLMDEIRSSDKYTEIICSLCNILINADAKDIRKDMYEK